MGVGVGVGCEQKKSFRFEKNVGNYRQHLMPNCTSLREDECTVNPPHFTDPHVVRSK